MSDQPLPSPDDLRPAERPYSRRYAPPLENSGIPGIHYDRMIAFYGTDVVDLFMVSPDRKRTLSMWFTGNGWIGYLPERQRAALFEMDTTDARRQFVSLLRMGWTVETLSDDAEDLLLNSNE